MEPVPTHTVYTNDVDENGNYIKEITEKIKNLFNGTGSYAYSVATKAAMTESYAKSEAAKSNTYTKNGTYNYNYNSGNIFTDMF